MAETLHIRSTTTKHNNVPFSGRIPAKRRATDDDVYEHRLSKRFNLLNIEPRGGKLWIPVPNEGQAAAVPGITRAAPVPQPEYMQIEDTKNKVYVRNLDEELAEDENVPEEERLIFIPDIEKYLHGIPKQLLKRDERDLKEDQQLVLYSVPSSITVPESQDSVRKAIIESRARARAAAAAAATTQSRDALSHDDETKEDVPDTEASHGTCDDDAMDIE